MLFFTGVSRTASEVAQDYARNLELKEQAMRRIGDMVQEGIAILNTGEDLENFGRLLHEGWVLKRSLSERISNANVDEAYEGARSAGAIGGKLLGAGGGGFLLLFVRPGDQARVRERLRHLIFVPFRFESSGSRIIFFDPEEDYFKDERVRANERVSAFRELTHDSR
jgi:D-glycero-alpha-D-manno-heptose-7-phosphate kinase